MLKLLTLLLFISLNAQAKTIRVCPVLFHVKYEDTNSYYISSELFQTLDDAKKYFGSHWMLPDTAVATYLELVINRCHLVKEIK